jgi:hypothetical protein
VAVVGASAFRRRRNDQLRFSGKILLEYDNPAVAEFRKRRFAGTP